MCLKFGQELYIIFPSNGKVFRQNKNVVFFNIINQQNSGDANLKNNLWLVHYQGWVQNVLSFGK